MDNIAAVPSPAIVSEPEQKIFKTALLGFKRDDVLVYLEKLNRESGEAVFALRQSIEQLEKGLNAKTTENDELTKKTQELEEALTLEQQRANESQQLASTLRLEADNASNEAASYKSRLFVKEQEVVVLKADSSRLNLTIEALTDRVARNDAEREQIENAKSTAFAEAEIIRADAERSAEALKESAVQNAEQIANNARFEAESILEQAGAVKASAELDAIASKQKCESEARLIRSKASNDALALLSAAEKEKCDAKKLVNSSAQDIANSIIVLKAELSDVDNRISTAVNELTRLTGGISGALTEAEKNLHTLGVQIEKFPERSKPVTPAAKPMRTALKRKTTSEFLLDKLTKLLK